jgi:hypothetical protein
VDFEKCDYAGAFDLDFSATPDVKVSTLSGEYATAYCMVFVVRGK